MELLEFGVDGRWLEVFGLVRFLLAGWKCWGDVGKMLGGCWGGGVRGMVWGGGGCSGYGVGGVFGVVWGGGLVASGFKVGLG